MSRLRIQGGIPLEGSITVQGSKNAALPILCACLLIREEVILYGCPKISDVYETIELMRALGARLEWQGDALVCDCRNLRSTDICGELTCKSRMSVLLFGAVLARCGEGRMEYPGGCNIGTRPIDLHEYVLRELGATLTCDEQGICGKTKGLCGAKITFASCSVGATENALIAATLARGTTHIFGAAKEPEVDALCDFLRSAGARIRRNGESELVVEGVAHLHGLEFTIVADRIVAGTYLAAAAITKGRCELLRAPVEHMQGVLGFFARLGCGLVVERERIFLQAPYELEGGITLKTEPYPGFPTDMQPFAVALLSVARGQSRVTETIFEQRFQALAEMNRLGAGIVIEPPHISMHGNAQLRPSQLTGADLRGGAALAVLALAVCGTCEIGGTEYIQRGYQDFAGDLRRLGASCVAE